MKGLLTLAIFIFLPLLQAQTVEDCALQGESFGDGKSKQIVSDKCVELFSSKASSHAKKILVKDDIKVFGYKNILFTEIGSSSGLKKYQSPAHFKTLLITGSNPAFEEVIALDIDLERRMIIALVKSSKTQEEAIFTFELLVSGNILPKRRIETTELEGATSLAIDSVNQKIIVLFNNKAEIKSFNLLDNTAAKDGSQYGKVQKIWNAANSSLSSAEDLALLPDSDDFYILDSKSKKVVKLNQFKAGSLGEKDIYSDLEYKQIEYNSDTNKLVVIDSQGKPLSINP